MKNRNVLMLGFLIAILSVSVSSYVTAILIDTGSYKLRIPLPMCDYYVGKFANATYFVTNGSNWDTELKTTVFETTISSIMSWGGKHIKLGSGDFQLSNVGLLISVTSKLQGSGVAQTTISTDGALNDHMIEIGYGADNSEICDLTIDGSGQGASYHGISVTGEGTLSGLWLYNLIIKNCGDDGIHLGDGSVSGYDQITGKMHTIQIKNNGGDGLDMDYDPTDWDISDMLISGHTGAGDCGVRANSDNIRFSISHTWGNYYEMVFADSQHVSGWLCTGNGIMDGYNPSGTDGRHRIYHPTGYHLRDTSFSGGQVWVAKLEGSGQEYDGFHFEGVAYTISVDGVIFLGGHYVGVDWVQDSNYAIDWDASTINSTISDCTFRAFNQSNPINAIGADITSDGHSFYNNG